MPDLSSYSNRDYRRFLSAHFQFLSGLCQLSIETVKYSIEQFLSSLLITNQLLSNKTFSLRIDSMIKETKSNAPALLTRILSLLRATNRGNRIVSTYGTNFEYIDSSINMTLSIAYATPIIYDNNCSCQFN
jgi:hypothetical protein